MRQNGREDIGVSAAEALWRIRGDRESLERLIAALASRNHPAQRTAAKALGEIGPAAKAALPALQDLLKHEDKFVRQAATEAVRQINAAATKYK